MTDETGEAPVREKLTGVSATLAAELARRRITWAEARRRMPTDVAIARTAWEQRMRDPGRWKLRELQALAEVLGVPVAELTKETS